MMAQLSSTEDTNLKNLPVGTIVVLQNLTAQQSRRHNGKQARIINQFNHQSERYAVEVLDRENGKGNVQICNIKVLSLPTIQIRNRMNTSRFFSCNIMKSQHNLMNGKLMKDFESILNGNCIYIPKFYNQNRSNLIFNQLLIDMNSYKPNDQTLQKWSKNTPKQKSQSQSQSKGKSNDKRKNNYNMNNSINTPNGKNTGTIKKDKHERMIFYAKHGKNTATRNKEYFSPMFKCICDELSQYFDCDIYVTLLNYYPNGEIFIPYHQDSLNLGEMNITVGISFGATRDLNFLHVPSNTVFTIPQRNGDVFAFTSLVNSKFKHGVPKTNKKIGPRFSIIIFGTRRSLNKRNSGSDERKNMQQNYLNNKNKR